MTSAWSFVSHANVTTCLAQKVLEARNALIMWSRAHFGSVKEQKLHLLDALNELDIILESMPLTFEESPLKLSFLDELKRVQQLEETMWQQRARTLWLNQGDCNSKFFSPCC